MTKRAVLYARVSRDDRSNDGRNLSGQLDMGRTSGWMDQLIMVPVRIQNAPNEVKAFGLEFHYNPYVLEFIGFDPGECIADFDQFDVHQPEGPGMVRMGGYSATHPIPANSHCTLVYLYFSVIGCEEAGMPSMMWLSDLKDHFDDWTTSIGCFTCAFNGDLSGEGKITPIDALCALQTYLGICPTNCGECDAMSCDVNMDGQCTPSDALCIFKAYLGMPSCLDKDLVL